ncbi:hypothetical protein OF83DRAFT_1088887 [Amylostereum chailletii]|nr:hypothetical protein OF83DRAFT_1088887 [Amylostereum chailletii]
MKTTFHSQNPIAMETSTTAKTTSTMIPSDMMIITMRSLNTNTSKSTPCDRNGQDLPHDTPPPPKDNDCGNWAPFGDRIGYELADFCFTQVQLGKARIDSHGNKEEGPPFASNAAMEDVIDAIEAGDAPWQCFVVRYQGERPPTNVPKWMDEEYEVWTRDPLTIAHQHLSNRDFDGEWDYVPYCEFVKGEDATQEKPEGCRKYKDFMSGNWAWKQCMHPQTHGAMFMPVLGGSDKTTVSVATGQNDFYPLYQSVGNVHNNVRRVHRGAVTLVSFLSVPKVNRQNGSSALFRKFRRQLFHSSLAAIFEPLKAHMTVPEVVMCPDGHYRRVIYGLGPYIADYPEQVLLASVVQNWCPKCTAPPNDLDGGPALPRSQEHRERAVDLFSLAELWDGYGIVGDITPFTDSFPRADINELLSMDLLHQLIKGGSKDHLVTWVGEYLEVTHGTARAKEIMDDIDRRIALAPAFPGMRRFHEGRNFKQWTGDDSKALMKVYVNAIEGHVPADMVRAISAYIDFCYIARRSELTEQDLDDLDEALARFHKYRIIFQTCGVRSPGPEGFSLPCQHSMKHYRQLIEWFGAPNGLCTSITEAKHIKAIKEPWHRSNHYKALRQMLLTNQWIDKMAAAQVDFKERGMLSGSLIEWVLELLEGLLVEIGIQPARDAAGEAAGMQEEDLVRGDDGGPMDKPKTVINRVVMARRPQRNYPRRVGDVGTSIGVPNLRELVYAFLQDQFTDDPNPNSVTANRIHERFRDRVRVFHSAMVLFHAPSDPSGIGGMRREYIRSTPSWRSDGERRDCALVSVDPEGQGPGDQPEVARVKMLFSFKYSGQTFPCALIQWFSRTDAVPDADTGMWIFRPDTLRNGKPDLQVIHLDSIHRSAHLLPIFGHTMVNPDMHFSDSLNWFHLFYLNKWADHNSFDILYSRLPTIQ